MSQSRTLCVGMDVHQETMAVASVAQDPGAEVPDVGTSGTRQSASETRIRTMQSTAQPRIFLYDAGPCGSWLSRSLQKTG